jgi:uncharacterized hydrophobic protein (TIGR00271 family)
MKKIFFLFQERWIDFRDNRRQTIALNDFESGMHSLPTFLLLILLAGGIANIGILRNNQIILIAAMIITPLVSPFVGIPLSLITRKNALFRNSLLRVILGVGLFWGESFCFGYFFSEYPVMEILKSVPIELPEILLALLAGIVAAIAYASEKIYSIASGAAIAIALAPPLAISGIALSFNNIEVFHNSLLLFAINAGGLIIMGWVVFLVFGFRKAETEKQLN